MISLRERLTDILIKNKTLSQDDIALALRVQKEEGGRLSEILARLNLVDEKTLMLVLSQGLGLPLINLSRFTIDPTVIKLIPKETAKHYQLVPVSKIGNTLTLAMADPLNIFAIDDVQTLTKYEINPIIASTGEILETIEKYYDEPATQVIDEIIKDISGDKEETIEVINQKQESELNSQELMRLSQEAPIIRLANMLFDRGVELKASDILIEPLETAMRVRVRVDGVLRVLETPPKQFHASLVSRVKVLSDMNIAEHRLPQDGRFRLKVRGRDVEFRVSILPASFGEKVAIRILDKSTANLDLNILGFESQPLDIIKQCSDRPHGMMLVVGPTGSGKTTTLYSVLKYVDSPDDNIITVEDPVEYQVEGINQVSVKDEIGLTFASSLRSILRQDPDTIMIGEIRDYETADIAIKSALTGHRVLSTLHATTSAGCIVRLVNMGIEPFLITSSIVCVVAQRLVRKICVHCKEVYNPPDVVVAKLPLPKDKKHVFYKGKGCKQCLNSGYAGRTVLAEVLPLTSRIRELILERVQEYRLKEAARQEKMATLREDGFLKCLAGITTLDEIFRTTAPDDLGEESSKK